MSQLSDALHEAIVTAAKPFVGSIGADLIGTAMDIMGSIVSGSNDSPTEK
jgi:hypothetical protein